MKLNMLKDMSFSINVLKCFWWSIENTFSGISWLWDGTGSCSPSLWKTWYYIDVIMGAMASQITGDSIVYSIVCWGSDQRKHQSSASLAFVRRIHRWPVDIPHKGPVTRKCLMTSSWTGLSYIDNTMVVVDELATQGVRTPAVTVLT